MDGKEKIWLKWKSEAKDAAAGVFIVRQNQVDSILFLLS